MRSLNDPKHFAGNREPNISKENWSESQLQQQVDIGQGFALPPDGGQMNPVFEPVEDPDSPIGHAANDPVQEVSRASPLIEPQAEHFASCLLAAGRPVAQQSARYVSATSSQGLPPLTSEPVDRLGPQMHTSAELSSVNQQPRDSPVHSQERAPFPLMCASPEGFQDCSRPGSRTNAASYNPAQDAQVLQAQDSRAVSSRPRETDGVTVSPSKSHQRPQPRCIGKPAQDHGRQDQGLQASPGHDKGMLPVKQYLTAPARQLFAASDRHVGRGDAWLARGNQAQDPEGIQNATVRHADQSNAKLNAQPAGKQNARRPVAGTGVGKQETLTRWNKRKSPDLLLSPTASALQSNPHTKAMRKLLRHDSQPGLPSVRHRTHRWQQEVQGCSTRCDRCHWAWHSSVAQEPYRSAWKLFLKERERQEA